MADVSPPRRFLVVDAIAGVLLLIFGVAAAWQATGFDAESRSFPLIVSGLVGLAGLAILATAGVRAKGNPVGPEASGGPVALAVLAIVAWILAMTFGAGFVLPTFALQLLLLSITGVRGRLALPATAATITALAYLLFVVVFDIPMPPSRLPGPLQDF